MIRIDNNTMTYAGVSFSLPGGMYLDTSSELIHDNGICMKSEDNALDITIMFNYCDDTPENLLRIVCEDSDTEHCKCARISCGGLSGAYAFYRIADVEFFEIQFERIGNFEENCSVVIRSEEKNMPEIIKEENIRNFLAGFAAAS